MAEYPSLDGRCGATVDDAGSVSEAIALLERSEPDIVVSDIAMPDADGFALLRHIRETRRLDVPVIAMTAFGHTTDRDRILTAGFSGYLKKPVEPIDLAEKLHGIQRPRAAK